MSSGTGILAAAVAERSADGSSVVAVEQDANLAADSERPLSQVCHNTKVINASVFETLLGPVFDRVILNPPYKKISPAGSSERRNTLDSEGIETWCSSSTGPSTGSCGTCRRRDARSTGPGARRHGLHPGRPRGRCVQTRREGLAQRQDTFHRPQRAAALGPVPWRHGQTQADRRRTPAHGRAHRHRRHAPLRRRPRHRPDPRRGAQHQREHQRLAAPVLPPREPTRPDTPRNTPTQPPWNPTTGPASPRTT
ncbi:methyltransferase [Bifidobacterium boum]|uniref:methyltransferase n=1 Tax=Bifidobacterium boum TaxID=78343 RepID=UPI001EE6371D|nr:methyltransferase [Bifidobacterium boum]